MNLVISTYQSCCILYNCVLKVTFGNMWIIYRSSYHVVCQQDSTFTCKLYDMSRNHVASVSVSVKSKLPRKWTLLLTSLTWLFSFSHICYLMGEVKNSIRFTDVGWISINIYVFLGSTEKLSSRYLLRYFDFLFPIGKVYTELTSSNFNGNWINAIWICQLAGIE
jgi:hypothetical protein